MKPTLGWDPGALERLKADLGGATDSIREIVQTFLKDADGRVAELRSAVVAKDRETLSRAAHTLKSTSALVGAVALSEASKRLELDARTLQWGALERHVADVAAKWATVKPNLEAVSH